MQTRCTCNKAINVACGKLLHDNISSKLGESGPVQYAGAYRAGHVEWKVARMRNSKQVMGMRRLIAKGASVEVM